MNWTEMQADWDHLSPILETWFPKLNDDDMLRIAGSREQLTAVLRQRYGIEDAEAERQICAFEKEVRLPGAVR
jgi:uncharacterized protein YjbJ (UPF0337 family)